MEQEHTMQLQMLGMQLQQYQQYLQMLEEQTQEVAKALESIEELQKTSPGTTTYVPLTNGIYVKATLENNKEFLINAGNNIITAQTATQAKKLLHEQQQELEKAQERISKQFSEHYQEYLQLQIRAQEGQ